jgi:hypothetical protein
MKTLITLFVLLSFNLKAQQNVFALSTPFDIAYVDFEVYNSNIYAVTIEESTLGDGIRGPIISKLPIDGSPGELKKLLVPDSLNSGLYSSIRKCNLSNDFVAVFYSSENCETYIVKFDQALNVIWCKVLNFPPASNLEVWYMSPNLLTITAQDEILISLTPNAGSIITKLDVNGNLIFTKKINNANPTWMNPGNSFIVTSDGGYLLTLTDDSSPTIVKLNSSFQVEWSKLFDFNNYSSPLVSAELSNGNFVILLEESSGTKIAEMNSQGQLLSIKQSVNFTFPYVLNALSNGNYQIFDHNGTYFKSNSTGSTCLLANFDHASYGLPIFRNGNRYVYNRTPLFSFYFIVNDQASSCYNMIVDSVIPANVSFNPNDVIDAQINIENFGSISNFTANWVLDNTIHVTESCGILANEELENSIISIYPNPSSGSSISLELGSANVDEVRVFNSTGQLLKTISCLNKTDLNFTLAVSSGMYYLKAFDKNNTQIGSQKLVIE